MWRSRSQYKVLNLNTRFSIDGEGDSYTSFTIEDENGDKHEVGAHIPGRYNSPLGINFSEIYDFIDWLNHTEVYPPENSEHDYEWLKNLVDDYKKELEDEEMIAQEIRIERERAGEEERIPFEQVKQELFNSKENK